MNLTNRIAQLTSHADIDTLLKRVGLERSPSFGARALPALGLFGGGFAVGFGAGLLLAPTSGRELRASIAKSSSQVLHGVLRALGTEAKPAKEAPDRAADAKPEADGGNGVRTRVPASETERTLVIARSDD